MSAPQNLQSTVCFFWLGATICSLLQIGHVRLSCKITLTIAMNGFIRSPGFLVDYVINPSPRRSFSAVQGRKVHRWTEAAWANWSAIGFILCVITLNSAWISLRFLNDCIGPKKGQRLICSWFSFSLPHKSERHMCRYTNLPVQRTGQRCI
jgi:hypothetical protein